MNNDEEKKDPQSGLFSSLRDIAIKLLPGLPWHVKAYTLVLIILALFLLGVFIFVDLGKTLNSFLCVLFIILVFFIVFDIRSDKKSIRNYLKAKVLDKNTINFALQLEYEQKEKIQMVIEQAAKEVAKQLSINSKVVRSNIFGVDEYKCLMMIPNLSYHMDHPPEKTIKIPLGYGSTGRCFKTCQPNIAVLENDWGKDMIEDEELKKVHPDLKWIISVPILGSDQPPESMWVLNVDGIQEKKTVNDLRKALSLMFKYSNIISIIVAQKQQLKGGHGDFRENTTRQ